MNGHNIHNGAAPHAWLQHNLPWLGLFALVMNLFQHEAETGFNPDAMNG